MSDYFLNKIYDSLLSKKTVPKKPEPIVEKKEETKTLQESYQLMYKKHIDKDWSAPVNMSTSYFQKVLQPVLGRAGFSTQLRTFLKRAKQSGVAAPNATIDQEEIKYLFDYTAKSTDVNKVVEVFNSPQTLKNVGNRFINLIASGQKFNYITTLNEVYGGNLQYDPYVINTIKPVMAKTAARGMPGPGEAFIAFFYGGQKPEGAGDLSVNGVLFELKKSSKSSGKVSGGRVGKGLIFKEGIPLREIYVMGRDSKIDIDIFNRYVQQYNLITNRDFLFGKGEWSGVTGVENKTQYEGPFLNQKISIAENFALRQDFENLMGAIHLIDYITKIKEFDYLAVFNSNNEICGFDISTAGKDPYDLYKRLVAAGFYFRFKSGGGSMFDEAGMQIFLK